MSRIGKLPIIIPNGVSVAVQDHDLSVTGPKGTLTIRLHDRVKVAVAGQQVAVTVVDQNNQFDRALWGLSRALIANLVAGVVDGFSKRLEINGVGFRAAVAGSRLNFQLGFSHPVEFAIPPGISVTVEKNVITVSGIDRQLVGQTAANIRALKPPEPYKGKGIKYSDEVIRRKAGKVVKAAGAK